MAIKEYAENNPYNRAKSFNINAKILTELPVKPDDFYNPTLDT
ncbi:hypothetical protein [Wolbachia endosymbiont of Laodelphax striatellus]|nr:hypothetical protein [Wolbachia endosymbiont of Laodelphax striatellus]